jgi:hypothetical protein
MAAPAAQRGRDPFAEEEGPALPGPLEQYDEIDALLVERNAAVAEAKLWLRRALATQKERDQARADLRAVDKCLGEWQAAYDALLRDFRRLEVAYGNAIFASEAANFLIDHLQPLAMAQLALLTEGAPE